MFAFKIPNSIVQGKTILQRLTRRKKVTIIFVRWYDYE
jgi:hypothetical protein